MDIKQLWANPTCEGQLMCPEERVSSLNKYNPIQSVDSRLRFSNHKG